MPGFGLVLLAAATGDVGDCWSPWRHHVVVKLGELSFAFYLVHLIVIRVGEVAIGYHPHLGNAAAVSLTVLTFTISLSAAWLLHAGVERPARTLLLRRRRPRRSAAWECQDQAQPARTPLP
jgi:peptidoglycan/LPS O-acetylase OafA/YrhL